MSGSETEWIAAAARGEAAAFGEIYRRHSGRVFDFAYRMTGSRSTAEDITHDAFVALLRHPERFQPERGSLPAFLCAIARNHLLHHLRRAETRLVDSAEGLEEHFEIPDPSDETPLTGLLRQELALKIEDAIAALPPIQRETLILREYEELSYEEIAVVIGENLGVVKVRLFRARRALAQKLAPYLLSNGDLCHEVR